jgi:hypothetical protein
VFSLFRQIWKKIVSVKLKNDIWGVTLWPQLVKGVSVYKPCVVFLVIL